jgi:D-amino peptidase
MKLYVSVDIEGVAGVTHWDQIMPGSAEYALGRRLLMGELNALCQAAEAGGVTEITVNDAHGPMRNIVPDELYPGARLITGNFKPMYMMEGIDDSFDAAVFLAYHGAVGTGGVLSHSYNPRAIHEVKINGVAASETGINALVAHHFGVPVVMITGDNVTVYDATRWIPEATGLEVKRALSRTSAESISPEAARQFIAVTIQKALSQPLRVPPKPEKTSMELTFHSSDMASIVEWIGATPVGERTVTLEADDGLSLYKKFFTALVLARSLVE